jgi:hypothetical protein
MWRGRFDRDEGRDILGTWEEFAEFVTAPRIFRGDRATAGWSAAIFGPLLRAERNVRACSALVFVFPREAATVSTLVRGLRGTLAVLYPAMWHGSTSVVVVFPLSRVVTRSEHSRLWESMSRHLRRAIGRPSSRTRFASAFVPFQGVAPGERFQARCVEGDPLDPDRLRLPLGDRDP